jgi:hypothetical protein
MCSSTYAVFGLQTAFEGGSERPDRRGIRKEHQRPVNGYATIDSLTLSDFNLLQVDREMRWRYDLNCEKNNSIQVRSHAHRRSLFLASSIVCRLREAARVSTRSNCYDRYFREENKPSGDVNRRVGPKYGVDNSVSGMLGTATPRQTQNRAYSIVAAGAEIP